MRNLRVSSRVAICATAVLAVAAMASAQVPIANCGFNANEDSPAYVIGDINGQGSAIDNWEASWTTTTPAATYVFGVADGGQGGTGDQYLSMPAAASSSYQLKRAFDGWNGGFTMSFDVRFNGTIPSGGAPAQFQLEGPGGGSDRALHIKWEIAGTITINNTGSPRSYITPTDDFLSFIGNWVSVKIVCDWDAAGGPVFDLYCEKTDGSMGLWATKVGFRDTAFVTTDLIETLRIDAMKGPGWDWDNISLETRPLLACDTVVQHVDGADTGYEFPSIVEYRAFEPEVTPPPPSLVYTIRNRGNVSHNYSVEVMVPTSIAGLYNTGVGNDRAPLGDQVQDPHYVLAVNPDNAVPPGSGSDPTYTSLDDTFPIPPWLTDNATSKWITVRPSEGDSRGATGDYTYQTTFTSPASTTHVYGKVAADDNLVDILVNGASKGISTQVAQWGVWKSFQFDIEPTDSTLSLQVYNGGTGENPTGLRAEFYGLEAAPSGHWLTAPAGPIAVGALSGQDVTVMFDTNALQAGVYRSFVKFSNLDNCEPPIIREVVLTVINWFVDPLDVSRDVVATATGNCPGGQAADVVFTVGNIDSTQTSPEGDITYGVTEEEACSWLTLDKSGGTIPYNNADEVIGSIDPTGLAAGTYTCSLAFTNTTVPSLPKQVRAVTLRVLPQGQVWRYNGDVDPLAADSAGSGLSFKIAEDTPAPVSQGQVEDDPDAGDGKVWRLTDATTAKTKFRSQPDTMVSGALGATMVVRMRVHGYGPNLTQGLAIGIWDDEGDSAEIFYDGSGGNLKELDRNQVATVAADGEFHIIRLTVQGTETANRVINVYFDENTTPAISIVSAGNSTKGNEGFVFGAGSTSGEIDVAFDWISATNAGAFAPGEEEACLGESLVLSGNCPEPFADADGDGDVDQVDFAAFQRCYTGTGGTATGDCRCFNRDVSSGDNDIDETDYDAFEKCATGAGIQWQSSAECP